MGGSCIKLHASVILFCAFVTALPILLIAVASVTARHVPLGQSPSFRQGAPGVVDAESHCGRQTVEGVRLPFARPSSHFEIAFRRFFRYFPVSLPTVLVQDAASAAARADAGTARTAATASATSGRYMNSSLWAPSGPGRTFDHRSAGTGKA